MQQVHEARINEAAFEQDDEEEITDLMRRAKRTLNVVAGAALQMQRELQWFKEVEKVVQPTYMELENKKKQTPTDVFVREHKDLMDKGEQWMKDVMAFFSSVTSVLMFLSIPTSRYAMEDFLELLLKRLILGLASLFFSIAAMMVAFSATLCLVLNQKLAWAFLPIGLVASFPVSLYVLLQFPLLVEMIHSTYWPDLFHGDTEIQPGTHY
ncbi:uncharacterized protein LOC113326396 [Papaver somniferum]|uniref:uncharacterized protein LOC113326396 n=1 Tax=Papaver somniferum TaxID=3469 RepID=UPI000E7048E9|nr:uncharacterized protein LOC113326396 [Papaver somniferum]